MLPRLRLLLAVPSPPSVSLSLWDLGREPSPPPSVLKPSPTLGRASYSTLCCILPGGAAIQEVGPFPRDRGLASWGGGLALLRGVVEWVGVAVPCLLDYLAVPSFRGPDPGALGAEPGLELLLLSQLRTEPGTHIPCLTGTTFVYKLFGRINNYLDVDNSLNLK